MNSPTNDQADNESAPTPEEDLAARQPRTKPAERVQTESAMERYGRRLAEVAAPHGHIGKATVANLDILHLADSLGATGTFTGDSDSLAAHEAFNLPDTADTPLRLADIGSGAGLPGIPLAIARPALQVFLVESRVRAAGFLQDTVDELHLDNVTVFRVRAEALAHDPEFRETFHLVTARALANTAAALELCLPLCKIGGRLVLYKTAAAIDEVRASEPIAVRLGGKLGELHTYELPGLDQPRVLACFEKTAPTPAKFPRRTGVPGRHPLKP